jgi:hypothetical protein
MASHTRSRKYEVKCWRLLGEVVSPAANTNRQRAGSNGL